MKILVTGAGGQLGSQVCVALQALGHGVRAMVRDAGRASHLADAGIELAKGDLADPASLESAVLGMEAVVHAAAAILGRDEEQLRRVNVDGTFALLDAMARTGTTAAHLVFTSSISAGGFGTSQQPLQEDMIPSPATSYGRTKLEAEEVIRGHSARVPWTILRLCTLYGPRDRFFPVLYRIVAAGLNVLPEGGSMEMSLLHVDDAARAVVAALEAGRSVQGSTFYVADTQPVSWRTFNATIQASLGKRVSLPINVSRRLLRRIEGLLDGTSRLPRAVERRLPQGMTADVARLLLGRGLVCDGARFREATGWKPMVPLDEGLYRTIAWEREHGSL